MSLNLSEYTSTELLKMVNDTQSHHEIIKKEIVDYTFQVDKLEETINNKIDELTELEKNYILLIDEISKR